MKRQLFEEFRLLPQDGSGGLDPTGWLMFIGILRDDLPWFYVTGMDLYRALLGGDSAEIAVAKERVLRSIRATENKWVRDFRTLLSAT